MVSEGRFDSHEDGLEKNCELWTQLTFPFKVVVGS